MDTALSRELPEARDILKEEAKHEGLMTHPRERRNYVGSMVLG